MRDFNEILCNEEKPGGANKLFSQMERFREALEFCEFSDQGYQGSKFAWSNRRERGEFTKERLDRVLGNNYWPMIFGSTAVQVLPAQTSDHSPLFISCANDEEKERRNVKLFRYEACWSKRQDCKDIIEREWRTSMSGSYSMNDVKGALKRCKDQLRVWAKANGGSQRKQISLKREMIQEMQKLNQGDFNETIKGLHDEVDGILEDEEIRWRQRCPYGFLAGFYQDNWDVIASEVVYAIKEVLSSRRGVVGISETLIALIPKKKHPVLVSEYMPISLCNVLYKIVSKVLANRMRGKKESYMALKLDMSKAYDRIERKFLAAVMKKMGFGEEWSDMIMQCVGPVSYSLLINGSPQNVFHPSRGLRQGDPLSPYLFIPCSEVLGTMLDKAKERGFISGFPFARGSLLVNHLFFANDSLLFCKANVLEWSRLVRLLNFYEVASGQRLNME
ncbi:uncharacterized protein LOC108982475 [Juglans regia]|uniref:Uncharacterized protein LOC108982475 n=1 Tax=Juglans regia TaxID=51240 RepID=A0A6P9EMD9_JUGRE|nr:uncharacterized protein LOC108982475 [Juglans regia]